MKTEQKQHHQVQQYFRVNFHN